MFNKLFENTKLGHESGGSILQMTGAIPWDAGELG